MEPIEYHTDDRIAYLTLNRPGKRNALNNPMVGGLQAAFERAAVDAQVKVIVLKANGAVFCAGADLEYLQQLQNNSYEENLTDSRQLATLFETIHTLPKVVIAQVQGHALAGGCGLATVCDFSFAVPEARFGYTEVKIGFVPAIVSYFLCRKIGEGRARELLLTGNQFMAAQAQQYGLVNFIAAADGIERQVQDFAQMLCRQNSAQAMAQTKKIVSGITSKPLAEAMDYAAECNAQARATADCKQGIAAFLDKKELNW